MECHLICHTHWDREWYRTFQEFRAHLVDVVDGLLEILERDPGYRFVLDGQAVVIEDYLAIRPERAEDLARACDEGRVAIGPWYVQPDSLLPSGEAHIRNLLEGRRSCGELSRRHSAVAYVPDSFGHPAQFPQLFAGFGLDGFLYWRGDDDRTAQLGPAWRWEAPDGSAVTAIHLPNGYFGASNPMRDPAEAADRLARTAPDGPRVGDRLLLLNGGDHLPADPTAGAIADRLAEHTGWAVHRSLFDDALAGLDLDRSPEGPAPTFRGELRGAARANLLPGVASTHLPVKLAVRRAEGRLSGWLEPWSALLAAHGGQSEQATLRQAWRSVLVNQAHDSLCGCSADAVMAQVTARMADSLAMIEATIDRVLAGAAGAPTDRLVPFNGPVDLIVANPSPHPRSDVVRFPLDGFPLYAAHSEGIELHQFTLASLMGQGITVDGTPARVLPVTDPDRVRMLSAGPAVDVEIPVADIPALGWRRFRLELGGAVQDEIDDVRSISNGHLTVSSADDGTLTLTRHGGDGDRTFAGLLGLLDEGDRGDTYDFDPVPGDVPTEPVLTSLEVTRSRHPNGISELRIVRVHRIPASLTDDRQARSADETELRLGLVVRLGPGATRADIDLTLDNRARDHRLRLAFPTGLPVDRFRHATTFDIAERSTTPPASDGWRQPAPAEFVHQGWIEAGGLTVVTPGLPEAVVTPEGKIQVTVVRSVGWLARNDHRVRPEPAGPEMETPSAQCEGMIRARLGLIVGASARDARDAELGLRAAIAGPAGSPARVPEEIPLLELDPTDLMLDAVKEAQDGDGLVVRISNPTGVAVDANLRVGFPVTAATVVRLDETRDPSSPKPTIDGATIAVPVGPRQLRTVRLGLRSE